MFNNQQNYNPQAGPGAQGAPGRPGAPAAQGMQARPGAQSGAQVGGQGGAQPGGQVPPQQARPGQFPNQTTTTMPFAPQSVVTSVPNQMVPPRPGAGFPQQGVVPGQQQAVVGAAAQTAMTTAQGIPNQAGTEAATKDSKDSKDSKGEKKLSLSLLAIVGLILGVLGVATSFIPVINIVSFFIGIAGAILSVIGLIDIVRGRARGQVLAIVGIALCMVTLIIVFVMLVIYESVPASVVEQMRAGQTAAQTQNQTQTSSDKQSAGEANTESNTVVVGSSSASTAGAPGTDGSLSAPMPFMLTIDDKFLSEDGKNYPAIIVQCSFTNNSTTPESFASAISMKAYQDGQELPLTVNRDKWNFEASWKMVQPGETLVVTEGYRINGDTPVTIEVKEADGKGTGAMITNQVIDLKTLS